MNPEDRIRMLMEENAMLRAQLGRGNPYAEAAPSPRAPLLDGFELEDMEAELDRRLSGEQPERAVQQMPYKGGQGEGPYIKKMPYKRGSGGNSSQYIRKL